MQVLEKDPSASWSSVGAVEFQVVLLAGGPGSRMSPLSTEIPKPLLPIANRPMISYQLEFLERAGFSEVIIVAQEEASSELRSYVHEIYKGKVRVDWHFLADTMGTAEALLQIKDKIKTNFIVMSSDLVVDEKFLHGMADLHRLQDAMVTLLISRPKPVEGATGPVVDTKNEYGLMDYVGLKEDGERLLYFKAAADIENKMRISKKLLRKNYSLTIHTNLVDAHFYIFSKAALAMLEARKEKIVSIKGELIPYLVRCQFRKAFTREDAPIKRPFSKAYSMTSARVDTTDKIRCFAYTMEGGYCSRANTIKSYVQMNLDIASRGACYSPLEPVTKNSYIHPAAVISPKTQVGAECVVGEGTRVGERASIKKSVIGKHCVIHDGVKIINSVIMNHVTISAGCVINGSVVCNNVYMKEKCNIKDSQIGVSYNVPEKTDIKNESLCRETEGMGI
jgi:translation initiation factor eIF-2B subunit gamma